MLYPRSYSQIGQDLLALRLFHYQPAREKVFLDVGAFDGIGFSNTRLFFDEGWTGVCIEPVMKNYLKLEKLYENTSVITVRAAAADYEGELELNVATIPWAKDWGSDVSSSTNDILERWPEYEWEKEAVPARTLNSILEENRIGQVDFISIDVEGQELAVLRGLDLKKYNPLLLVVEYSSLEERYELVRYMYAQGYAEWLDNRQDIFFVHRSAFNNWKVAIFGAYQRTRFCKPRQQIGRLFRHLVK